MMKTHPKLEADSLLIASLKLSDLRLMNNQQYPWVLLIPRVENAMELIDLSVEAQHALMDEISAVSQVLKTLYAPDKLNIAAIGNIVRQLHVHLVVRYRNDPAWPSTVWGYPGTPYSADNLSKTISLLQKGISDFSSI
jgi:diadenosine tetraphosphate (Ap4A) HIT family hydrolase